MKQVLDNDVAGVAWVLQVDVLPSLFSLHPGEIMALITNTF
jgi:hypothetical protein